MSSSSNSSRGSWGSNSYRRGRTRRVQVIRILNGFFMCAAATEPLSFSSTRPLSVFSPTGYILKTACRTV